MKNDGVINDNEVVKFTKYVRNRVDIAPQALLMAAGVILSIVLISVMVAQMNSAGEMSNLVSNDIAEKVDDIRNSSIMQYDGLTVNGADVVNFYKKQFDDYPAGTRAPFIIEIDHSNDGSENGIQYTDGSNSGNMRDSASSQYVKPSSLWKCTVHKNKNGIITKVSFVRQ